MECCVWVEKTEFSVFSEFCNPRSRSRVQRLQRVLGGKKPLILFSGLIGGLQAVWVCRCAHSLYERPGQGSHFERGVCSHQETGVYSIWETDVLIRGGSVLRRQHSMLEERFLTHKTKRVATAKWVWSTRRTKVTWRVQVTKGIRRVKRDNLRGQWKVQWFCWREPCGLVFSLSVLLMKIPCMCNWFVDLNLKKSGLASPYSQFGLACTHYKCFDHSKH